MVAPRRYGSGKPTAVRGSVRIIGGHLRGSRLPVPDVPGLRPSADRVRETLFNWLQHDLHGARVLDLFAGSGALGFEAASRGAAVVVLVERHPQLAAALRESAARLAAAAIEVRAADALAPGTLHPAERFDGAFVDPPFAAGLWPQALKVLLPRLAPRAWLYLEGPPERLPELPPPWVRHREGRTREVCYVLYRRDEPDAGG
jgi:16S rRNA (guanine966-N2)-methyltransferase